MAQEVGSRSLRSLDPTSCLPSNASFQVLRVVLRPGVHLAPDAGLGGGLEGRLGPHPTRPTDAERTRRKLPRKAARRVPERKLVQNYE
jgi:hypothetical protein